MRFLINLCKFCDNQSTNNGRREFTTSCSCPVENVVVRVLCDNFFVHLRREDERMFALKTEPVHRFSDRTGILDLDGSGWIVEDFGFILKSF